MLLLRSLWLFGIIGIGYLGFFILALPFSLVFLFSYLNVAVAASFLFTILFLTVTSLGFFYLFIRAIGLPGASWKKRAFFAIGVLGCLPACITLYGYGMRSYMEHYIFPREQQRFTEEMTKKITPQSFQNISLTPVYLPGFETAPYALRLQFTLNLTAAQLKRIWGDGNDAYTGVFFDPLTFDLGSVRYTAANVRLVAERENFRQVLTSMQGAKLEDIEYYKRNNRWRYTPFFHDQFDTTPAGDGPITFTYYLTASPARDIVVDESIGAVALVCFAGEDSATSGAGNSLVFRWGYKQPGNGSDLNPRTHPELSVDLSTPLEQALAPFAGRIDEFHRSSLQNTAFTEAKLSERGFFRSKQMAYGAFCMANPVTGYGAAELVSP